MVSQDSFYVSSFLVMKSMNHCSLLWMILGWVFEDCEPWKIINPSSSSSSSFTFSFSFSPSFCLFVSFFRSFFLCLLFSFCFFFFPFSFSLSFSLVFLLSFRFVFIHPFSFAVLFTHQLRIKLQFCLSEERVFMSIEGTHDFEI